MPIIRLVRPLRPLARWRRGYIRRRTCDQQVAGSTPRQAARPTGSYPGHVDHTHVIRLRFDGRSTAHAAKISKAHSDASRAADPLAAVTLTYLFI